MTNRFALVTTSQFFTTVSHESRLKASSRADLRQSLELFFLLVHNSHQRDDYPANAKETEQEKAPHPAGAGCSVSSAHIKCVSFVSRSFGALGRTLLRFVMPTAAKRDTVDPHTNKIFSIGVFK